MNGVNGVNGVNGMNGVNGVNGSNGVNGANGVISEPAFSTMNGAPVQKPAASQRIGDQLRATLLLQDINLLELIQHITHERIPER